MRAAESLDSESDHFRAGFRFMALVFAFAREKIVGIDVVADPVRLRQLDLAVVND